MPKPLAFRLRTARTEITLRRLMLSSSEELYALIDGCRAHLNQYGEGTATKYPTLEKVRYSFLHPDPDRFRYGIYVGRTLVGSVNITLSSKEEPILGYWIGKPFIRQGYAKTAVRALTRAVLDCGYDAVIATTRKDNEPSQRTLLSAGFRQDQGHRSHEYKPEVCFFRFARKRKVNRKRAED